MPGARWHLKHTFSCHPPPLSPKQTNPQKWMLFAPGSRGRSGDVSAGTKLVSGRSRIWPQNSRCQRSHHKQPPPAPEWASQPPLVLLGPAWWCHQAQGKGQVQSQGCGLSITGIPAHSSRELASPRVRAEGPGTCSWATRLPSPVATALLPVTTRTWASARRLRASLGTTSYCVYLFEVTLVLGKGKFHCVVVFLI